MAEPTLSVEGLVTHFFVNGGVVKAVDDVDLTVGRGEIVTVVGESGSGKSVTALSIMRLVREPGRILDGRIRLGGTDLLRLSPRAMRAIRGNRIAMIFQNPYAALHPYFRIGHQMVESLILRDPMPRRQALARAAEMLERIGVDDAGRVLRNYPFEVSAGVCQRVMLAMALASRPELLIADEPTTNLDALAQSEILRLIREMREEIGMSVLLITHDFGVVSLMADQVFVMYAGRRVEAGPADSVLARPKHPYAVGLLESVSIPGARPARLPQIPGEVPDVMRLPPGCSFRPRCRNAMEICRQTPPDIGVEAGHAARCWLYADA